MPLYKFIEREFLEAFFRTGSLRLGTIYDFKDIVEHGVSRGDEAEGEHHLIRGIDGTVSISKDKYEPIISEIFRVEGEGKISLCNLSVVVPRRCQDGFIFCTSSIYNEQLFRKWNKENDLDACYEIINQIGFISAINKAIKDSATFFACSNVTYTEKQIDYQTPEANLHPAFTKVKDDYSWQHEHRIVWGARGPSGPLNPWIVYVPEAIQYCRPFAFLENGVITQAQNIRKHKKEI
ncbi:hypothetical protein WCX49_07130 [Sulfurimonas sp. HSL-1656]|uniref:hypothetical protein n=1 Tax=Thiomicrolovo subterrani TaxID=3131934 RepID=UPI0031F99C41